MTPQLQQAVKLLQYNRAELVEFINTEMLENPTLEERPVEEPASDPAGKPSRRATTTNPFTRPRRRR